MKTIPNFFDPEQSVKIIELYKDNFKQDIRDLFPDRHQSFELDDLHPKKIFWLNHLSQFIWLQQEIIEMDDDIDFDNDIFEILTDSEYSKDFLLALDEDRGFKEICLEILDIYQQQLDFIQKYHLNSYTGIISKNYRLNQDLGDIEGQIGGEPVPIEGSSLSYLAGRDAHYERASKAVGIIRELAPEAFKRLNSFTQCLIPLNEKGMVSFSSESLPFYSCINFLERDNVDLLDDLLHENGHHQLNFYLYNFELINEDDPNLYFSPWRECLRPLRGIYHGYCTFYWAYDLFKNLLQHIDRDNYFTSEETNKISRRYLEEREMLLASYTELIAAKNNGYISIEGMQVVKSLHTLIESDLEFSEQVITMYNNRLFINELRQQLSSQRQSAYNQL